MCLLSQCGWEMIGPVPPPKERSEKYHVLIYSESSSNDYRDGLYGGAGERGV